MEESVFIARDGIRGVTGILLADPVRAQIGGGADSRISELSGFRVAISNSE